MSEIPSIAPVRNKNELIPLELIVPDSVGYYFPDGVGTRVVYLDEMYAYPDRGSDYDLEAERARQTDIWGQFYHGDNWVQFMDRQSEQNDRAKLHAIGQMAFRELGHRNSAAYYERVFSEYFDTQMNLVIIATGVTRFTRENYHDIGYLR